MPEAVTSAGNPWAKEPCVRGQFWVDVRLGVGHIVEGLFISSSAPDGEACNALSPNINGMGRTSNIPNPPRTEVLPEPNGSHAKPNLGSKFLRVGFVSKTVFLSAEQPDGRPVIVSVQLPGSVQSSGRRTNLPFFSKGIVDIS